MFFEPEEALCYEVDLKKYDDTHGLSEGYPCRRHLYEAEGNLGASEARADWAKILGPSSKFGNANPINGSFTALTFPLCRPERVRLVTYIIECESLHVSLVHIDFCFHIIESHTEVASDKLTSDRWISLR